MKALSILSLLVTVTHSFHNAVRHVRVSSSLPCICVNCKYVTNCVAYHFVEEKHEQPHISANPTFEPRNGSPTINVHMKPIIGRDDIEKRMRQEHKEEEYKAMANAAAAGSGVLIGETVYDMRPEMSLEYDVVECEDFVEDKGCWVRNMPEAIRLANPNFVPP
ncbi:putative chloroplast protein Ycf34 [Fragilaria crotonensis]|nr:putative chloroplast protein Ycf34 [Fragilaria crotonensis]